MYSAIVMLLNQTPESFMPDYADELQRRAGEGALGPNPTITRKGSRMDLTLDGVEFLIHFNIQEVVGEEAKQIAQQFASDHPDQDTIARTDSRLEITSGEDPDMNAFNSFVTLIEAAEALAPAWHFDPAEGAFQ